MIFTDVAIMLLVAFFGYLVGRCGDYVSDYWLNDPAWAPHHWIYGLVLMIVGVFYLKSSLGLWAVFFGFGVFISDLKDFLDFKFIGKDNKPIDQRKFWHIN